MEIGKVSSVHLTDGGKRVRVDFSVDRSVPLYQSATAQIRYLDLIGNRYLELNFSKQARQVEKIAAESEDQDPGAVNSAEAEMNTVAESDASADEAEASHRYGDGREAGALFDVCLKRMVQQDRSMQHS